MPSYKHPNYEHRKLVERLDGFETPLQDAREHVAWVRASKRLDLLRENADSSELIIYASGPRTLVNTSISVNTVIVPEEKLALLSRHELYDCCIHGSLRAHYAESNQLGVRVDAERIDGVHHLVFERDAAGFYGETESYFEALQEYCQLADIHWREDQAAYCRFNILGDVEHTVSITLNPDQNSTTLISFMRGPLQEYLIASNSALVRAFEFFFAQIEESPLLDGSEESEHIYEENNALFYTYEVSGRGTWRTHGIQIIRPNRSNHETENEPPIKFMAWDFRDDPPQNRNQDGTLPPCKEVPADPSQNISRASYAFFRPEVLLKYKMTLRDTKSTRVISTAVVDGTCVMM